MWGAGDCHCHRRRLRPPLPPSLALEEGDCIYLQGVRASAGEQERRAQRTAPTAPAPGRLRRAPAPGGAAARSGGRRRRGRDQVRGGGGGRKARRVVEVEDICVMRGVTGGQVYVNNGQTRLAGVRWRAGGLAPRPRPLRSGLDMGLAP